MFKLYLVITTRHKVEKKQKTKLFGCVWIKQKMFILTDAGTCSTATSASAGDSCAGKLDHYVWWRTNDWHCSSQENSNTVKCLYVSTAPKVSILLFVDNFPCLINSSE